MEACCLGGFMNKYCKKAIFHLPGIFEHSKVYGTLVGLYLNNRHFFMDNLEIGSIYGSPGCCIWNGGRMLTTPTYKKELVQIMEGMREANIPVRFTFTNCLLEEKHVYDAYANFVTSLYHNGHNEILCNSPILEKYLRENYPKYKFISSTTKRILDPELLNKELEKDYKLVVLDYDLNKNKKLLKKIRYKKKIELLCNAVCMPNCPRRAEHYINISKAQLELDPDGVMPCEHSGCPFYKVKLKEHFLGRQEINQYLQQGFCNFKLEGRSNHVLDLVEILLYYLIKDEYQDEVRVILEQAAW